MRAPLLNVRHFIQFALSVSAILTHATYGFAETVILHDGTSLVGSILTMNDNDVVVESNELGRVQIRRTSVKSINGVEIASASQGQSTSSQNAGPSTPDSSSSKIGSSLVANALSKIEGQVGFGVANIRVKSTSETLEEINGSSPGTAIHWTLASYRQKNGLTYSGLVDVWQSYRGQLRRMTAGGIGVGWSTEDTSSTGGGMFTSQLAAVYGKYQAEQDYQFTQENTFNDKQLGQYSVAGTARIESEGPLYGANISYTHFSHSLFGYFIGASMYGGRLRTKNSWEKACNYGDNLCKKAPVLVTAAASYAGLSYKF